MKIKGLHFHVKICGSSGEPCCGIVNIADFNSLVEGQLYNYMGEQELQDCYNFPLDLVNGIFDVRMTVYHEGSDGVQFDWVEYATDDGGVVHCFLGNVLKN